MRPRTAMLGLWTYDFRFAYTTLARGWRGTGIFEGGCEQMAVEIRIWRDTLLHSSPPTMGIESEYVVDGCRPRPRS
jgi:hypothetical protein